MLATLAYGHPRRKAVRVEDDVWNHASLRKRHILCRPFLTADTLLTVTTGKLVSDDRIPLETRSHADGKIRDIFHSNEENALHLLSI